MKKVQVSFTDEEVEILNRLAKSYGWRLSRYIKFILAKEVSRHLDTDEKEEYIAEVKDRMATARRDALIRQLQKQELDLWE